MKVEKKQEINCIIESFHNMWDEFPGPVRLIDKKHNIVAINTIAEEKGFLVGLCCAKVGEACAHIGCKANVMFKCGYAQIDKPGKDRIRGWIPIRGNEDLYVHFSLTLPEDHS